MPARATGSATLSFGLVSIPVKLYTATSSESVSFNMLHAKCKGRLKMQYWCPTDQEVVERTDTVKGYEHVKGQYVVFTDEELKALEAERSNSVDIVEFVPAASVDLVQVEKSWYLGPDKGGDKAYRLLGEVMREKSRVAVGRWAARGKEHLVAVRPYGADGLLLHQLFYANEVRAFSEVDTGARVSFSEVERELAGKLVDQLSVDEFDASRFRDGYAERVTAAVERKVQGQEVTAVAEAPRAQIIDLFEALKRSLQDPSRSATERALEAAVKQAPLRKAGPRKGKKAEAG